MTISLKTPGSKYKAYLKSCCIQHYKTSLFAWSTIVDLHWTGEENKNQQTGLAWHLATPVISSVTPFKILSISIKTKGEQCYFTQTLTHPVADIQKALNENYSSFPPSFLWQ